ncbi:hypothetical protein [Rhodoblastus sp.]|jgi:hypothetical protein|uniref:hypothetical protein n=1 Tax=Rhodoblastus sp. TaxID=1962975 RepID=UPI0025D82D9E|nr:hypothetical protein [Rhodoblastus sp.]
MKRSVEKSLFVILVAGFALGAGLTGASALECPKLQSPGGAGAASPDLTAQLSSKDALAQIPGIFASLQQQFPGVSKPILVDYLIASYCPVVKANTSLSDEEKMARVKEFADRVVSKAF